ncbi:nuclear cap binding complex subunit [Pichia californica]|nr:nuclear cap binding complex subunit [[Candida] californica]
MENCDENIIRVFVVRHGQTNWNIQKILQGHQDIPLNEEGHIQAKLLGDRFKDLPFDCWISSDLTRCIQTTKGIESSIGPDKVPNKFIKSASFRERFMGDVEGMKIADAKKKYGNEYRNLGETRDEMIHRIYKCWLECMEKCVSEGDKNDELTGYEKLKNSMSSSTIYIGHLVLSTTEEQIFEVFSQCGKIKKVIMGLNAHDQSPTGFCFVIFKNPSGSLNAVKYMNKTKINGKMIDIDLDPGFEDGRQYGRGENGAQKHQSQGYGNRRGYKRNGRGRGGRGNKRNGGGYGRDRDQYQASQGYHGYQGQYASQYRGQYETPAVSQYNPDFRSQYNQYGNQYDNTSNNQYGGSLYNDQYSQYNTNNQYGGNIGNEYNQYNNQYNNDTQYQNMEYKQNSYDAESNGQPPYHDNYNKFQ